MKKYILIFSLFITLTAFSGCYTVIWSPDMDDSTSKTYQDEYIDNGYYPDPYYGGYGYYYDSPWWITVLPPAAVGSQKNRDENSAMERIRNRDGSRNTDDGRNSGSDNRGGSSNDKIIKNDPATRSGSSGSGSTGTNKNNNTPPPKQKDAVDNTSSGSSSSGSSGTSSRSGSGSSDNGRSSDSGRSSSGGGRSGGGR